MTKITTTRGAAAGRREQIIEATLRLLGRTTVEGLTTRKLARQLRLSQPALFRHFRSREQLLLAVVARTRADLEQAAVAVIDGAGDATEQLRALGQALLLHAQRYPGVPRLLFSSVAPPAGPVREAVRHVVAMQSALVAEIVRQGQRQGKLAHAVGVEQAATLFVGMLQGLVLGWEMAGRREPLVPRFGPVFELWLRGVAGDHGGRVTGSAAPPRSAGPGSNDAPRAAGSHGAPPPPALLPRGVRSLDVRPLIAHGVDPLVAILAALDELPVAGVLALSAPFKPAPLLALLARRGHAVRDEALGRDRWLVQVVKGGGEVEDLRDLEPPGPLERVLCAAEALRSGQVFLARVPRHPRLLLPHLRERGLDFAVEVLPDGSALLRVVRPA